MRGENDNLLTGSAHPFVPSRLALFLPVVVIAIGYLALLIWLGATGQSGTAIARLSKVVLGVATPLLVAHATLRLFTISIRPLAHAVLVHTGFPRSEPVEIPYPLIRAIHIRRGIGGYIVGSGTLVFELVTGQNLSVCDLARPQEARATIESLIDSDVMGNSEWAGEAESDHIAADGK